MWDNETIQYCTDQYAAELFYFVNISATLNMDCVNTDMLSNMILKPMFQKLTDFEIFRVTNLIIPVTMSKRSDKGTKKTKKTAVVSKKRCKTNTDKAASPKKRCKTNTDKAAVSSKKKKHPKSTAKIVINPSNQKRGNKSGVICYYFYLY